MCLSDELGGFSQRMMSIEGGVRKLVQSTAELKDKAFVLHSRHVAAVMPASLNSERRTMPCFFSRTSARSCWVFSC